MEIMKKAPRNRRRATGKATSMRNDSDLRYSKAEDHFYRGVDHVNNDRYTQARFEFITARKLFQSLRAKSEAASCQVGLGNVASELGEFEPARTHY
ncbi:MAG TPA: hypothetical protein PKA99_16355, partial [Dermatophilaceae bacterium]|nr:hypothetical protein [Dermatophilaceae bacterium]